MEVGYSAETHTKRDSTPASQQSALPCSQTFICALSQTEVDQFGADHSARVVFTLGEENEISASTQVHLSTCRASRPVRTPRAEALTVAGVTVRVSLRTRATQQQSAEAPGQVIQRHSTHHRSLLHLGCTEGMCACARLCHSLWDAKYPLVPASGI